MKSKTILISLASILIIIIGGLGGYFALRAIDGGKESSPTDHKKLATHSGRMTLYTVSAPYVGGPCGYISFTDMAAQTEECIDDASAEKVAKKLKADNPSLDIYNQDFLMKIDAQVHSIIESRSPATAVPQPRDVVIIVIDKLYSVSLTDLKAN